MLKLVVSLGMANQLPYVAAAFVCEKVLREADGVHSVVRIVDRFNVPEAPSDLPPQMKHALLLTAFVGLKSGDVRGQHAVSLRLHYPSGKTRDLPPLTEEFRGDEHGVTYTIQVTLEAKELGLYWFDVVWDDGSVLTRIPFRLRQAEDTPQPS